MPIQPSDEEERWFEARESEKRAGLRKKMALEAKDLEQRRKIAESTGADVSVADRIAALGFSGDSARIVDLMPLVHVAWADGTVQRGERAAILRVLKSRGIAEDSDAFTTMAAMLEQRPDDTFMAESLEVVRDLLGDRVDAQQSLVDLCVQVAASSGGLLGLGQRVSDDERALIAEIADTIGDGAAAALRKQLG